AGYRAARAELAGAQSADSERLSQPARVADAVLCAHDSRDHHAARGSAVRSARLGVCGASLSARFCPRYGQLRAKARDLVRGRRRGARGDVGDLHRAHSARARMTPGARVAAAIEVIADIEARRRPAADALKDWGLSHRFAGSGDRAAIAGLAYDALRRRVRLAADANNPAIHAEPAFIKGLVEIQDEGSQLAALLTDAKPGAQVVDLCAGAGGKTLALAAMMEDRGQVYATDQDKRRLAP